MELMTEDRQKKFLFIYTQTSILKFIFQRIKDEEK